MSEYTLALNVMAFRAYLIVPRVLVSVDNICIKPLQLPFQVSSPIAIAPTALQRMAHSDGEIGTFKAAKASNQLAILSSWSSTRVEDLKSAVGDSARWFQLYVYRDRNGVEKLVKRVEAAGFTALVVTVDTPVLGNRQRDLENEFKWPPNITLANMTDFTENSYNNNASKTKVDMKSALAFEVAKQIDPRLTWKDINWLSSITCLPIILKGILTAKDAILAIEKVPKLAGIIVSNHGGRQLDDTLPTIDALVQIKSALDLSKKRSKILLMMDGGIRRGTDVFKALALGADLCFIGRPVLWGLSVEGQNGVTKVLQMLDEELKNVMALAGCKSIKEISRNCLISNLHYGSKI